MPDSKVINNPFLDEQNTTKVSQPNGSKFDPSTAKPVANTTPASNNKNTKFDPSTAKAVDKGFGGHIRDLGASLMGGLASVPDVAVGVADLYSGGRAGKAVDNLSENFKLGDGRKYWQDQKTDHVKVQSQEFSDAEGIIDKTKVALSNPSMIANTVVESLPSMALGGLAGRGLNVASKGLINPVAAGAAGEGLVMAGAQAEQIRQETDDGLLTGKQVAAAAGTGVAGSLLGFLGGTVAKKLGFEDVDTLMARGVKPEQMANEISQIPFSSIPKSVVLGAISEGLLEEMPQSVTEQVLQNYALDKDLFEGVDDAIVMGTLAGMAMGGTVAGASQASKWAGQSNAENPESGDDTNTSGSTPMLPVPTGGNGGTGLGFDGLQGEYIPAGQQDAVDPVQARQNFEYDQMPTDAERQIEFGGLSRQYVPTPSQQMGLDPNLGPLSAAAATAVDNGVSQQMQIEMQAQAAAETTSNAAGKTEDSNAPLQQAADAARELTPEQIHGKQNTYGADVTTAIEQLKQRQQGDQNAAITFDEGIQNGTIQQGNAPLNNGSQSVSEQHDTNAALTMGAAQKGLQPAKSDAGQIVPPGQSPNEIQTSKAKSKLLDAQSKVTELEAQLVIEKSVPKKAQIRKQITELQNELSIQTQSDVNIDSPQKSTVENHRENFAKMDRSIAKVNAVRQRMREANPEIFTEENDRVRETHGLTNARVSAIADEIESSGSYELSDREYDKIKNNPNYKIDYNPKTFTGKVIAVKDQHSGEWLGNNEDSDLDNAAHAAATSIQNDLPEPTQAQIEAGNYKKGHIKVHGLDIAVEKRGLLDIVSTVDEPGVEGFYQNGRVTLVANNLNETSIIPTFLHELGGHGGFQNVMSEEKYADLMGIFNDMVQRKHPLALEAKRLAERETDTKTQQLEYLPYLLTLASTQQEMNALQKSAIKRFIDKVVSAVKAWAFDRLGINLNLNENDMVALANRMIQQQIAEPTSVENVRAQLQGTDQWMKAPNGKPTNLTEQQWLQVRTPEFKQWFGDWENSPETSSKVVDENGEPQVVYHGTSSQFTRFKLGGGLLGRGVYLTDRFEEAQNYAGSRSQDNEGTVMPLFANIPEMFNSNSKTTREQIVDAMQDGFNGIRHQFNDMDYLVAFNPEQVKSAIGNTGLFSSQDTDIRFSRQANAQQIIQNLVGNMNKQGRNKLKTEAGYKATHALQYVLGALGRRQLTELYQKLLPQLKPYNDMVAMMDADQNEVAALSDELARRWADLKDEKELANVMHDATLAKIDPAKPYQPGDNVAEYAKLKKQFDALSDDAKKVYREARDAYKKHHRDVRQAIQDRILRSSMSNQKKTELLQQMDANFFGYTQGVYFPLQRFGKYVVLVRDTKDQVISVSRAETLSEAHKLREILQGDYPNAKVHKPMLDKEYDAARDGVGRGFMTNLFNELGSFGLNAQRQAELEDILGQLYLKSLPDLSYAKHSVHRKGTAGFSQDARRAFAQNMFHGGSYLAKLRYKDQLEEMLDGMQKHATEQAKIDDDYDQPVAQQVIDEMNKRHKNMMEANSHPLSTALTSLGFLYYLGLSPASAAVNTLQTVLVAYPQMGAKWGYDKAGAALAQASNDFRKGVSIKGINPKNWENDIAKILKGDELKAYEEAVRRGVIDVTMAHDLAGIAQGEDSGVMWKLRPIMRVASTLFHNAERFNREVTFIAAYRLARDSGSMHDQAFEQAMDSTYKGHFDYSSGNRPRIMQGNIAKVILLFKQFGQNMIYTLARTAHQSLKGETPEARREAQRALAGIIGMHTVFAGVMGLPLVGPILAMASMLGSDDDEPWDAEAALRNALADALGTKTSEVLMKGASRFGPADLSGRVGINNLLLPDVQDGLEGKDFSDAMVMSALGPVVGIITNTFKGLAEIGQGHGMRGVETMSPVFLRSPLRSIRYATEGAQDKTGVMIKDDVGMFSLAAQAVGFSPSEVRLATEGRSAIYSHTKRLDKRRTELMNDYVRTVQRDDMDGQKEIWAEIQAFNQKNPSRRISRVQAMQSLRQREKRVKQAEYGIYLPNKKREDADIGRFAFDE